MPSGKYSALSVLARWVAEGTWRRPMASMAALKASECATWSAQRCSRPCARMACRDTSMALMRLTLGVAKYDGVPASYACMMGSQRCSEAKYDGTGVARDLTNDTARALSTSVHSPGGAPRAFCEQPMAASTPHSSKRKRSPPKEQTPSTAMRALGCAFRATAASAFTSLSTAVDVSTCVSTTSCTDGSAVSAACSASSVTLSPTGHLTCVVCTPYVVRQSTKESEK